MDCFDDIQIEELQNFDFVERDLIELIEEENDFNMKEYLNGNYDYWWLLQSLLEWFSPPFLFFGILKTVKVVAFTILHLFILLSKNDS